MIRTTNSSVPQHWAKSQAAQSGNGQYSTDGSTLYSYNKPIGITTNGQKILLDYTAATGCSVSTTTSQHVGKARPYCDQIMHPKAARLAKLI